MIVYSILANLVVEWLRDFEVKKNLVKFDIKELFLLDSNQKAKNHLRNTSVYWHYSSSEGSFKTIRR